MALKNCTFQKKSVYVNNVHERMRKISEKESMKAFLTH